MSLDKVVCDPRSKVSTTSNVDPSDARGSDSSTGIATECCVQVNLLHVCCSNLDSTCQKFRSYCAQSCCCACSVC